MPGRTTEVVNEDLEDLTRSFKDLGADFSAVRGQMRADMKWIKAIGAATFGAFLAIATASAGIIWQASKLDSRVARVEQGLDTLNNELGRLKVHATTIQIPKSQPVPAAIDLRPEPAFNLPPTPASMPLPKAR